eukprot:TRINITY_DN5717_c0_g1_i1.p1 TRINITY_DN5717_c0_g1~~TRINITY_DN5717_c0_g1_i1.p1  ORF type:complete len:278 (-),score=71.03 TRINITY_DN5717_c0_g1_i1:86-919(-)
MGTTLKPIVLLFFSFIIGSSSIQFNETFNWYMMQHASAAYCHPPDIPLWNCTAHCVGTFKVTAMLSDYADNTLGYVGYDDQEQINMVAFRGTESTSLTNWIEDLDFSQMTPYNDDSDAYVHAGFYGDYLDLRSQVIAAVKELTKTNPSYKMYVVGHSLGAALATLAAVDIVDTFDYHNITLYDFGGPRVGDSGFVEYAQERLPTVYRAVNQRDIVPHLPPQWLGWAHLATEVWYWDSEWNICNSDGEDPNCSDGLLWDLSILDHIYYPNVTMGHHTC